MSFGKTPQIIGEQLVLRITRCIIGFVLLSIIRIVETILKSILRSQSTSLAISRQRAIGQMSLGNGRLRRNEADYELFIMTEAELEKEAKRIFAKAKELRLTARRYLIKKGCKL